MVSRPTSRSDADMWISVFRSVAMPCSLAAVNLFRRHTSFALSHICFQHLLNFSALASEAISASMWLADIISLHMDPSGFRLTSCSHPICSYCMARCTLIHLLLPTASIECHNGNFERLNCTLCNCTTGLATFTLESVIYVCMRNMTDV